MPFLGPYGCAPGSCGGPVGAPVGGPVGAPVGGCGCAPVGGCGCAPVGGCDAPLLEVLETAVFNDVEDDAADATGCLIVLFICLISSL